MVDILYLNAYHIFRNAPVSNRLNGLEKFTLNRLGLLLQNSQNDHLTKILIYFKASS